MATRVQPPPRPRPRRSAPASSTLEQGIAINGELRVKFLGMNLLPIQVRLLISSSALAQALGVAWWPHPQQPAQQKKGKQRQQRSSELRPRTLRRGSTRRHAAPASNGA